MDDMTFGDLASKVVREIPSGWAIRTVINREGHSVTLIGPDIDYRINVGPDIEASVLFALDWAKKRAEGK